jgi:DNA-binding MarR family transcriptional regulator
MDYIRQLGPAVLDHRFRRMMETLLRSAEEIYEARGLQFRGRWASTYQLLYGEGPLAVGQIADRLRLTHPGVIGITDEMLVAEIVDAVRDPDDARRRILALTPRGKRMAAELFSIWTELGKAQRNRFAGAGCDIMAVLEEVEDGLIEQDLAAEVLEKLENRRAKKSAGGSRDTKRKVSPLRRVARAALSIIVGATILSACSAAELEAQSPSSQPTASAIDAAARSAVVNALSDSLINGYIYEQKGRMMADTLRAELRSGAFDGITDGDSLALRLTQTLRRLSDDRHLGVRYGAASPGTRQLARRMVRVPAADTVPLPPGAFASPDHGFARAEVLAGNIGYLDLRGFSGNPDAMLAADSAMALFAHVKALIIDLGRNRGGGAEMIQYISAYLFAKPTHLVSSFARGMEAPMERWTAERVTGKRRPDIPVYILTSGNTISAAESFTFGLRINNRATVVGERTAGGGHFGGIVPLTAGFSVFLPRGRTYDPRTDKGWEAEGLKPDVEVSYPQALSTALRLIQAKR